VKVVYILRNPGVAGRTPPGWESAVIEARSDAAYEPEELRELQDADALVVGLEPVGEALLSHGPGLKLIQRLGVGFCNVDLEAAASRSIPVCNMPDFNAATVAEHTIMLMLALLRRVFDSTLAMKAGHWPLTTVVQHGVFDLQGRRVGILGLGAIGRAVASRLAPFGVELVYHDRRGVTASDEAKYVELEALLRTSDVVTIHLPLTTETRRLIGRAELGLMKRSAILINTARGAVVEEDALAEAVRDGRLAGAGLDVFSDEPPAPGHPLQGCSNVLLSPHVAGQTREAMERMVVMMQENLERVASGEAPRYEVRPTQDGDPRRDQLAP
jgi:phosphoglycerate dehydrogenase-like enzyme